MKLVLSPHPDDAEYSVAATILKNPQTEYVVYVCSIGGDNDDTTSINRMDESHAFWNHFPNVRFVGHVGQTIANFKDWEIVQQIDELLKLYPEVDTVYVPPLEDNHFEHRKVSESARASLRGKNISLIEYHTPSTRSTWNANHFVDVTDFYEKKVEYLQKFKSQLHRNYFNEYNLSIFHEDYFCRLRGMQKVEKFKIEFKFE